MIKKTTFEKNKDLICSDRKFHPNQIEFFKFAMDAVNNDRNTNQITVFPARCGLGKSTFLRILIRSWLVDNPDRGLIVVTDNLQRLSELNGENDDNIAYITSENKHVEIARQAYCPVLLISTQRYFLMDDIKPFLTYTKNGVKYRRDTIIFDEAPYFYRDSEIGIDELNTLHSALNNGATDLCDPNDKAWLVDQYNKFRGKMIDEIESLEHLRKQSVYLYHRFKFNAITNDDTRFNSIIKNSPDIFLKYPTAKQILSDIRFLIENGGFFASNKLNDSNDYRKNFIIRRDFKDKFMLGKTVKTFIFDATAEISENYPIDADWLNILDCERFNVSLDFMKIHVVDVNTTRNALLSREDKTQKIDAIAGYISEIIAPIHPDDLLFVTYKNLLENHSFEDIGLSKNNCMYFGNIRGNNDSRLKHTFIQVGMNRQTGIKYLMNFLGNNLDFSTRIKDNCDDPEESIEEIDRLMRSDLIDSYMTAELTADFVQNLFRTKARDIFNTDPIEVYLFTKKSENLMMELNYHLARFGAIIDIVELDCLKMQKIKNRKGDTKAKQILEWIEKRPLGEFDISEMLSDLNLTNDWFKKIKKRNTTIKQMFDQMKKPGSRGRYLIT